MRYLINVQPHREEYRGQKTPKKSHTVIRTYRCGTSTSEDITTTVEFTDVINIIRQHGRHILPHTTHSYSATLDSTDNL